MRDGLTFTALLILGLMADGIGPWWVLAGVGVVAVAWTMARRRAA